MYDPKNDYQLAKEFHQLLAVGILGAVGSLVAAYFQGYFQFLF